MAWGPPLNPISLLLQRQVAAKQPTGASQDPAGVYRPPPGGYPDGQIPWNARLPNAMTRGGAGRPVPRMTMTPEQQAALNLLQDRSSAESTPFRGNWSYALTPKNRKALQQFNAKHPVIGSEPAGDPGKMHGYNLRYHAADGTSLTVPVRVERSYGS